MTVAAFTILRCATVAFFAATVVAGTTRAHPVSPFGGAVPTARQVGDTPDTVLPTADLLNAHCDGTPITGDVHTADETSGTWVGDCTLLLAAPDGVLAFGAGSNVTIDGSLTIALDGIPAVSNSTGGSNDDDDNDDEHGPGELEWEVGANTTATSIAVSVRELEVDAGASLTATTGALALTTGEGMDVEEGATIMATVGNVTLTAGEDIDVGPGASIIATVGNITLDAGEDVDVTAGTTLTASGGNVAVTAGIDLDMGPGVVMIAGGDMTLTAVVGAVVNDTTLNAGGALVVTAPDCITNDVVTSASTSQVCE